MNRTVQGQMTRPIIFSGEMVRAILDGRKTQTRRIIKAPPGLNQPAFYPSHGWRFTRISDNGAWPGPNKRNAINWLRCPFGVTGDRLWVRETWAIDDCGRRVSLNKDTWLTGWPLDRLRYPATDQAPYVTEKGRPHWWNKRPSIHMPRWASRITLEITKVRVERLQDISEEDAKAEGVEASTDRQAGWFIGDVFQPFVTNYMLLWESLHGEGAWDKNPWVWILDFKRHLSERETSAGDATRVSLPKSFSSSREGTNQ